MKAVLFRDTGIDVESVPEPEPGPDEALIRVDCAGICGTDLEIAAGYMGFRGIPGHEFTGTVVRSPDPQWVDRRVTGEINLACGTCSTCSRGEPGHCPHRTVLGIAGKDGAFAEYVTLPLRNLHAIPGEMEDRRAVFAEPIAAALRIVEQVGLEEAMQVLVLGDGRLGQLCARVVSATGADPVACGNHRSKLALLERRGIRTVLAPMKEEARFDLVVEATGSREGLRSAMRSVRPRGTIVLKSTYHGNADLDLSPVVIDEVTVIGSRCGPFAPALDLLSRDRSITEGLVTATYPLVEAEKAFAHAGRPESLKILLRP
jgi:threonine dehydrogenase-like Zn-dependent dehydrogenase